MFDVLGLPLHPLVVHAVVALLPLSALGLVACVLVDRWRGRYAGLTVLGLLAATVAAFVAASAGHALAETEGTPVPHANLGDWLPRAAVATLVIAAAWYFLQRGKSQVTTLTRVLGVAGAVAALGSVVLTVLVGHSGAVAVWGSGSTAASAAPSTSANASYTLAQVQSHASAGDCWVAIDGGVYDLTAWVSQHPGGADKITNICGTDATQAFTGQHAGDAQPASMLSGFRIGTLS